MSTDLLQTKLFAPRPRPSLIPRPQLIEKLNRGLQHRAALTLLSAPAGFGKSTLMSEWMAERQRPFAWLSLDERDGDPERFLTYFIAALQTVAPQVGEKALARLEAVQAPTEDSVLTPLLNDIAALLDPLALVLDDYHLVDAPAVDQALTFLLENLPPQLHLIITTREDPPLPLPRLRARGLLTELRADDLRFTAAETAAFLKRITGLALSADEIAALETRTEGWVAGLQLAALSLQGQTNVHDFIQDFAGDNRYILDYLVDEVLAHQPPQIRDFLLQTSILDQLQHSLCAAVTGQEDALQTLEALERGNLFLIPLDDKRQWYRYHHLFGGVLYAHLLREEPERLQTLHQRASAWNEEHGLTAAAVRHALAAADFARAATILELAWPAMDQSRQSTIWLGWVKELPKELLRSRPVLHAGYAWALLDNGQLEAADTRLRAVEQDLQAVEGWGETEASPPAGMVVVDEAQFHALPGSIASARTYLALAFGDMAGTVTYARQALDLLPQEDHLQRGTPAALLGLASWANGDLATAVTSFGEAMTNYELAGNILYVITGAYVLAEMKIAQGHLREALDIYEHSIQLAWEHGEPVLRGAADLYTGLSELSLELNDLPEAGKHLRQSKELGQEIDLPRWHFRYCVARARLREAQGDLDGARDALLEAQRHYIRGPVPDVRPIPALQARLLVARGRLAEAQVWVEEQGLFFTDDLSYLREYEHITLARIGLAQYRQTRLATTLHETLELLGRLLQAAEAGDRAGSLIEILILQALAHEAQDDLTSALPPLGRALALAGPQGYVRIFIAAGAPMARLLSAATSQGLMPPYSNKLRAALATAKGPGMAEPATTPPTPSPSPLVEPLSPRELEVLQLLAEGLSNRQIGERLFIALPTVKGHNRNIYSKLQVNRRTEAIARARELGLL